MLKNNRDSYGWISIIIHWLSAISVIGLFALGLWMMGLDYYSQWYRKAPDLHKSIGLLLAAVTLLRLVLKLSQTKPQAIGKKWETFAAKGAHTLLYLLLFGLFISGYLISTADGRSIAVFDWFEVTSLGELFSEQEDIAGEIHEWLAYTLIGLAGIHALAAFKHHFVNKDSSLVRMLKPLKEKQQ